jgi:hypothetical protein
MRRNGRENEKKREREREREGERERDMGRRKEGRRVMGIENEFGKKQAMKD